MTSSRNFIAAAICTFISRAFVLSWSLLELMACGTPVLAEANSMMEELIQPGVNGALWRGTPESLAQAILELLNNRDQLRSWGLQAKQKLKPTYLQQHCLDQLEQLPGASNLFLNTRWTSKLKKMTVKFKRSNIKLNSK